MKYLFSLILLIMMNCTVVPYIGKVSNASLYGKIYDINTKEVLVASSIKLQRILSEKAESISTSANKDGEYYFHKIPEGIYQINVGYLGYTQHLDTLTIVAGDSIKYDCYLFTLGKTGERMAIDDISKGKLHLHCNFRLNDEERSTLNIYELYDAINEDMQEYEISFQPWSGMITIEQGYQNAALVYLKDNKTNEWHKEMYARLKWLCSKKYNCSIDLLKPNWPY